MNQILDIVETCCIYWNLKLTQEEMELIASNAAKFSPDKTKVLSYIKAELEKNDRK